jgi:hypothetical protein
MLRDYKKGKVGDSRDDALVQVHLEGGDLARLPVLPQPPRDVEEDCLVKKYTVTGRFEMFRHR